ncbi:MAG TPA: hypothetical protein VN704_10595 [Verrucomicrobiae bacterium]|nr:hypothetical protein [Verrucomicrobiae bacterium]
MGLEILLGFNIIDNWSSDLQEVNMDNVRPFHYPNIFFFYLTMPSHTFVFYINKPNVLYNLILKEKYTQSMILQLFTKKSKQVRTKDER